MQAGKGTRPGQTGPARVNEIADGARYLRDGFAFPAGEIRVLHSTGYLHSAEHSADPAAEPGGEDLEAMKVLVGSTGRESDG